MIAGGSHETSQSDSYEKEIRMQLEFEHGFNKRRRRLKRLS